MSCCDGILKNLYAIIMLAPGTRDAPLPFDTNSIYIYIYKNACYTCCSVGCGNVRAAEEEEDDSEITLRNL
jgi:hypothetical protein